MLGIHQVQGAPAWVPGLFRTVPRFQQASQLLMVWLLLAANYFGTSWARERVIEYPAADNAQVPAAYIQQLDPGEVFVDNEIASDPGTLQQEAKPPEAEITQPSGPPPVLSSVPNVSGSIALTFDDGPYPYWTEMYLKILEVYQAPASFFVTGRQSEAYPALLRQIVAAGHEVGNHSYAHSLMGKQPAEKVTSDLRSSTEVIEKITGQTVRYFRPPYGDYDRQVVDLAWREGQRTVTWNVDPRDWEGPGYNELARKVVERARSGDIILLHEGKKETLNAMGIIINSLREKGFRLVTVSELLAAGETANKPGKPQTPSQAMSSRPIPGNSAVKSRSLIL